MKKHNLLIFALLTGTAFILSLFIGQYSIHLADMGDPSSMSFRVFFTLRLPRTVMAALAGAGLALAGYVFQTLFSNPIAAPDIIGVSSGASAGAACMILLMGSHTLLTAGGAMLGGFLAVMLTIALAKQAGADRTASFLLAGVAVNAISQALLMLMKRSADPERQLASIEYWIMGSFASVTLSEVVPAAILALCGIVPLFLLSKTVSLLSLQTDEAQMLGVPVAAMRMIVLILTTLVVTSITSITGLISFIGLIAPHAARLIRKNNDRRTMLLSMLIGAVLILVSDCIARSWGSSEIPISILTSLIGAPYLVFLLRKGGHTLD